jgi:NADH:ubiquinone oxidoreductase subunit B-like Fe-S oxidoreductase
MSETALFTTVILYTKRAYELAAEQIRKEFHAMTFGLACCAIEMIASSIARFVCDRMLTASGEFVLCTA